MFKEFKLLMVLFLLLFNVPAYSNNLCDIEIHAFASTGYIVSDKYNYLAESKDGTFEFNEAGVNFGASISEDMQVGMQLYSYDLGDVGNNTIKLDWAFIDYSWKEPLGLRLGKFKTPFALYSAILDYDMLYTQTILPQGIYNIYLRESIKSTQGINLYGKINMGIAGIFDYNVYTGAVSIDDNGSFAKHLSGENGLLKNGKAENIMGGRIKWNTAIKDLILVASYLQADLTYELNISGVKTEIETPKSALKVLSAEYSIGDFNASFEYQITTGNIFTKVDMTNIGLPVISKTENDYDIDTYYGKISYRFSKWFETGIYYSIYNEERIDGSINYPDYEEWQKDLAVCFRFDINDFWLMKFEIHHVKGVAQVIEHLQPEDYKGENWTAFAYKTTFNF